MLSFVFGHVFVSQYELFCPRYSLARICGNPALLNGRVLRFLTLVQVK